MADLAGRAAAYYRNLPQELRTPETERNHGLTLARIGAMLQLTNKSGAKAYIVSGLRKLKGGFARREARPSARSAS